MIDPPINRQPAIGPFDLPARASWWRCCAGRRAGDAVAVAKLSTRRADLRDPDAATAVANLLGPQGMIELPGSLVLSLMAVKISRGSLTAANQRSEVVLGAASDILAVATAGEGRAHVTRAWLARLESEGRTRRDLGAGGADPYYGYWALAQILRAAGTYPSYSDEFLSTVGCDMLAWVRNQSTKPAPVNISEPFVIGTGSMNEPGVVDGGAGNRGSSVSGLLIGLLRAAQSNRHAARRLLDAVPPGTVTSNLTYLLGRPAYWWSDTGDQFATVLVRALGQ